MARGVKGTARRRREFVRRAAIGRAQVCQSIPESSKKRRDPKMAARERTRGPPLHRHHRLSINHSRSAPFRSPPLLSSPPSARYLAIEKYGRPYTPTAFSTLPSSSSSSSLRLRVPYRSSPLDDLTESGQLVISPPTHPSSTSIGSCVWIAINSSRLQDFFRKDSKGKDFEGSVDAFREEEIPPSQRRCYLLV